MGYENSFFRKSSQQARLSGKALSAKLRVSRTPLRQALQTLSEEGLVTQSDYRGARVAMINPEDVVDLFDMRLALEPIALGAAVPLMTKVHLAQAEILIRQADHIAEELDKGNLEKINTREEASWSNVLHVGLFGVREDLLYVSQKRRCKQTWKPYSIKRSLVLNAKPCKLGQPQCDWFEQQHHYKAYNHQANIRQSTFYNF